ncbi:hypothetical protein IQ241_13600 [Romeria aff. gracilis LEGE 07310]|uniref:Uncharacterized protein n=1 Tax=Vasconcelosia minhoensis LEGE 07310 TaxID=915328 RepID=A0A8J7AGB0_9CYAN|nr:hypothetical protein [Romeria gracilis]MBE9078314.1 hypothetical protein [Romeria aff. gracilis LEGE 07310]
MTKLTQHLTCSLISVGLSAVTLPAMASPEISSGDATIRADMNSCLSRTDDFMAELAIPTERGDTYRTGFFEDGSFRIVCYDNPGTRNPSSRVVVFAAHDSDIDVANSFVQIALQKITQQR